MKKYGKFEKRSEPAVAKQPKKTEKTPKVKSVLLQTYMTSLLSLILCVTMFFGTSFAWFTSEVNNTANEIYIGTLDVAMSKETANGPVDFEKNPNTKLFNGNIRWEPGYTALETIKITDEGDLAFNYVLSFIDGSEPVQTTGTETPVNAAEFFEVWVFDHSKGTYGKPGSYADITDPNSGWVHAGSLDELFAGKLVLSGTMNENDVRETTPASTDPTADTTAPTEAIGGKESTRTYTLALHMNEEATAEVMGKKLTVNVKLVAYQLASEEDGMNNGYDKFVSVTDAENLKTALENQNGGNVILNADIDLKDTAITIPADATVVLELNGHKITSTLEKTGALITNNGNLTIYDSAKNDVKGGIAVTFNGPVDGGAAVNAISNRGVLTVFGGEITNTGTGNQIGYAIDNYNGATLIVNGGKISASGSSYYDGIRLFCGSNETLVIVNDGEISSIWAQNPSTNKATEVKGTVVINGGAITTTYYENYTTVRVKEGVTATVQAYGAGSDKTNTATDDNGYTVHSFTH